ncbi:MAG: hypothetical protein ACW99Q_28940, partial [Candidatus Kariarchaeaceae archaeon]
NSSQIGIAQSKEGSFTAYNINRTFSDVLGNLDELQKYQEGTNSPNLFGLLALFTTTVVFIIVIKKTKYNTLETRRIE